MSFLSSSFSGAESMLLSFMSWSSLKELCCLYGPQILLLATLLAITIFRREMSCNHCYSEEEENPALSSETSSGSNSSPARRAAPDLDRSWDHQEADLLLDGAGYYCSGVGNLIVVVLKTLHSVLPTSVWTKMWESLSSWWLVASEAQRLEEILEGLEGAYNCVVPPHPPTNIMVINSQEEKEKTLTLFPAADALPTDAVVHILAFLHSKDVLSFACVSQEIRNAVQDETNETSIAIWKSLWYRDYAWIVESWDVGRAAALRSFQSQYTGDALTSTRSFGDIVFTKDFYFRFGLSYLNYVLAGQCTAARCLVGLGGNIYDLTSFLDQHPGSPETVIVHAGRDASAVFESMRHTVAARALAQTLCVAVDISQSDGGFGVRPTANLSLENLNDNNEPSSCPIPSTADAVTPHGRPQAAAAATVEALYDDFVLEEADSCKKATRWLARTRADVVGEVHPYYDPFCTKWKAWYIDSSFELVFLEDF